MKVIFNQQELDEKGEDEHEIKFKVFDLLKRKGKVYTQIVPNYTAKELLPIIRGKVEKTSIINSD